MSTKPPKEHRFPALYQHGNVDPRQRTRTVPMQVLSLGYSRTGTMTMKAALEILGMPTYHNVTAIGNPPDFDMWFEAFEGKYEPSNQHKPFTRTQWDQLLGDKAAITDNPAVCFAGELVDAYPDAKVILHERDVDRWYKSFNEGVIQSGESPFIPIAELLPSSFIAASAKLHDYVAKYYFGVDVPRKVFRWHWDMNNPEHWRQYREKAKPTYLEHIKRVKRLVPHEKLLLINFEQGWGPLCEFLGKPIPDVPFPRVNETEAVRELVTTYILESIKYSMLRMLRVVVPFVVAGLSIFWYVGR